jgi:hypothetical protein
MFLCPDTAQRAVLHAWWAAEPGPYGKADVVKDGSRLITLQREERGSASGTRNRKGRRLWLSARALVWNSGPFPTFGYPRQAPW